MPCPQLPGLRNLERSPFFLIVGCIHVITLIVCEAKQYVAHRRQNLTRNPRARTQGL